MDSLYFSHDEKRFFDRVIEEGFELEHGLQWWVVRLAIAHSLQVDGVPDQRYRAPATRERGSELHLAQVTGQGQKQIPDYDDAVRLLLTIKHEQDLFSDESNYLDLVQRHARRGLDIMQAAWPPGRNFHDYLLSELYFGAEMNVSQDDAVLSPLDPEILARGLQQSASRRLPPESRSLVRD